MRIVDLREEWVEGWKHATATVVWERKDRTPHDIFFATPESAASMLQPSPNAFLLAGLHPAAYHFEKRIEIEGRACTSLLSGLHKATELHYKWFRDPPPIEIDAETSSEPFSSGPQARAALMFSGDYLREHLQ